MVKRTFVKSIFPTVKNKNNCYAQTLKRYRKKNNSKVSNFLGLTITTNICSKILTGHGTPGDYSYITSALVEGEGVKKCQFLLILCTKNMLT